MLRVMASLIVAVPLIVFHASGASAQDNPASAASAHPVSWSDVAKWPDFTGGEWTIAGSQVNTLSTGPAPLRSDLPPKPKRTGLNPCAPQGLPQFVGGEFFYSRDSMFLMTDWDYLVVRRIYMDGRIHGDPDPTYFGHSIGHWEGNTLVVDTVGLLPDVPVAGYPGNGVTHIIERYAPVDRNNINYTITIINPQILTRAWVIKKHLVRLPTLEVTEAFCDQNVRNGSAQGQDTIDLTPPP